MHLWQDGLLALLAAIGLASLFWALVRGLLFIRPRRRSETIALLPARGDGECLEEQVRSLEAVDQEEGLFSSILLADCGLTEEGRQVATLLSKGRRVRLCSREDIPRILGGDTDT